MRDCCLAMGWVDGMADALALTPAPAVLWTAAAAAEAAAAAAVAAGAPGGAIPLKGDAAAMPACACGRV